MEFYTRGSNALDIWADGWRGIGLALYEVLSMCERHEHQGLTMQLELDEFRQVEKSSGCLLVCGSMRGCRRQGG